MNENHSTHSFRTRLSTTFESNSVPTKHTDLVGLCMHFFSAYRNLVGITVTRYLDNNLSHNRWKAGNFKVSPDSDFPFVTVGVDY